MTNNNNNIINELRRPFLPDAVKFKVQTANAKGALVVSYIDARHVGERLNVICPNEWSDQYRLISFGDKLYGVECKLTVTHLTRTDIGTGSTDERMGGLKILYSDAFKRAAVKFGIGAFLYALPSSWLSPEHLTGDSPKWRIPDKSHDLLKTKYSRWLETVGITTFGEPLDHGDVEGSQGDVEIDSE